MDNVNIDSVVNNNEITGNSDLTFIFREKIV